MRIDDIIQKKQPDVHKELVGKTKRRRRKKNKQYKNNEHLSFKELEKMMRCNNGVNEKECNCR